MKNTIAAPSEVPKNGIMIPLMIVPVICSVSSFPAS